MHFRWNDWNTEHIEKHGVSPEDAEDAVLAAGPGFPRAIDDEKYLVWGQTRHGRYVQVVFVIDPKDSIYVIHARPLTNREKRRARRR